MRRQFQAVGIKNWSGQDLIDLQAEALKPLDAFFGHFPMSIISGCEVTANEDQTHNVAPGIVSLRGKDQDGNDTRMVVPFAGLKNTALPIYLKLGFTVGERAYKSGGVKPVYYDFKAVATTVQPGNDVPHITITGTQKLSFVDVIQSAAYRMVTDTEKQNWNGKATPGVVDEKITVAIQALNEILTERFDGLDGDIDEINGKIAQIGQVRDVSGWTNPQLIERNNAAKLYYLTTDIKENAIYRFELQYGGTGTNQYAAGYLLLGLDSATFHAPSPLNSFSAWKAPGGPANAFQSGLGSAGSFYVVRVHEIQIGL